MYPPQFGSTIQVDALIEGALIKGGLRKGVDLLQLCCGVDVLKLSPRKIQQLFETPVLVSVPQGGTHFDAIVLMRNEGELSYAAWTTHRDLEVCNRMTCNQMTRS